MIRISIVTVLLMSVFMINCGKNEKAGKQKFEKTSTAIADQNKTGTKKNNFAMEKKLATLKEVINATAMEMKRLYMCIPWRISNYCGNSEEKDMVPESLFIIQ